MENEQRDDGQKFSSGKAYVEGQTDFGSFLTQAKEAEKTEDSQRKFTKERPKKENPDEKFTSILMQAMNGDDDDFDDLEDGFEEATISKKPQEQEANEEIQEPTANEDVKIEEPITEEPETQKENISDVKIPSESILNTEKTPAEEVNSEEVASEKPIQEEPITEKTVENIKPEAEETQTGETDAEEAIKKTHDGEEQSHEEKKVADGKVDMSNLNLGQSVPLGYAFFDENDEFVKSKAIKRKFNPNPAKHLIEGHDFNDPYLNDIYCYSYSDDMLELRERKKKQREEKIQKQIEEEEKLEALKKGKKAKKESKKSNKPEKEVKPRKPLKVPDKYPKYYEDPTDEEIDDKTGKPYYYFNFSKTLANSKVWFLQKILPVKAIDEVLFDKPFLDGVADRQHEKAVRLNNMSPEEQYSRDLRNIAISIGAIAVFVFAVFAKITFSIIPDNKYEEAMTLLNNKDYENAYYEFTDLGNKDLSIYFAKYSEAKMYYKTEQYEKAQDAFTLLLPYQESIFKDLHINIEDEVNECRYQEALAYYYAGDFEAAKTIFKDIYTYSDSTEKYYECGYKIAKDIYENWQDDEDLMKALKYFYRVRKYTQSDVQSYIDTIAASLNANAENYYSSKDYANALNIYSYLSLFGYVSEDGTSAKEMVNQCTYRYGLDLYKNKQYESARKVLCEIPEYKDSYVLSKECIYNISTILYENNPVASIAEYKMIEGYRDATDIMYSPRLILYGQWEISEMNGSSISPVDFNFYDDGQFKTNKQILSVAISTDATPIYYEWEDGIFSAEDGSYTISCSYDIDDGTLTLTCAGPNQTVEYTCKRLLTYEAMILAEDTAVNTEAGEETLNQKFKNLIQDYVDKKTDGIVYNNGEDVDIFDGLD